MSSFQRQNKNQTENVKLSETDQKLDRKCQAFRDRHKLDRKCQALRNRTKTRQKMSSSQRQTKNQTENVKLAETDQKLGRQCRKTVFFLSGLALTPPLLKNTVFLRLPLCTMINESGFGIQSVSSVSPGHGFKKYIDKEYE